MNVIIYNQNFVDEKGDHGPRAHIVYPQMSARFLLRVNAPLGDGINLLPGTTLQDVIKLGSGVSWAQFLDQNELLIEYSETEEEFVQRCADQVVPPGTPYIFADPSIIPLDQSNRDNWLLDGVTIKTS